MKDNELRNKERRSDRISKLYEEYKVIRAKRPNNVFEDFVSVDNAQDLIDSLKSELVGKVEELPSAFPAMESDEYDAGLQDMKKRIIKIIKSL